MLLKSEYCCFHTCNYYTCRSVEGRFSDTLQMASTPVSLHNLCLIYIIRFLELFPVDYLALLPVTVRQRLLENLPPADVCRLEQSKFSEGLDIDGVWKKLSEVLHILSLQDLYAYTPSYRHHKHCTYKESFFHCIYSFLAEHQFHKGLSFDHALAEHRYKIVQCVCSPLRPQITNFHEYYIYALLPGQEWSLDQLPYWSLLDGEQEFPISTPNRYLPYYQPLPPFLCENIIPIKAIVLLTPTLCHYYPTALDININAFINTALGKLLKFTDDSIIFTTLFQQVEILRLALSFDDKSQTQLAITDIQKQCQKCMQTILPPARRVLQQFDIQADSTEALGYMLECIPILQDTLQTPQQSPRNTYSTLFPSLREVTCAVVACTTYSLKPSRSLWTTGYNPSRYRPTYPQQRQHSQLLQHFSTIIFLSPQCNSLTIDGLSFNDYSPSSQPFGSILHSFLTSSRTHKQRLILQKVNVRSISLPPPVVTPECSLHYKSLIIKNSVIPNSVMSWLLEKGQLYLKTLELSFKQPQAQWLSTGFPRAVLTQPPVDLEIKNVHVKILALHTTRNVVWTSHSPVVPAFSNKVLEHILLKPTLKYLDLYNYGLGSNSIVPHLTEALERRVQTGGSLQELILVSNHLGYVTDDNLQRLFNAIFSLPGLQELSLNVC